SVRNVWYGSSRRGRGWSHSAAGGKVCTGRIFVPTLQVFRRVSVPYQARLSGKHRYHAEAAVEKAAVDIGHGNVVDHCLQATHFKNRDREHPRSELRLCSAEVARQRACRDQREG